MGTRNRPSGLTVAGRWRSFYGANPLHLLALLACFGLAGYAALLAKKGPLPTRMLIWFVGAIIAHDLMLYPLYALADRSFAALISRRRASRPDIDAGSVNYLRVPVALSGLFLLMFWPLITGHSQRSYRFATGLDTSVYFGRWLLLSGAGFAVSAMLYAWRLSRGRRRAPEAGGGPATKEPGTTDPEATRTEPEATRTETEPEARTEPQATRPDATRTQTTPPGDI